jgi:hypothetical protein
MTDEEILRVKKPENFEERSRRVGVEIEGVRAGVKSRSVLAAERHAARLGKTVEEFTFEIRKRLRESNYPGPDCLEPYEVELYVNGKLADDRVRHTNQCVHCEALLKSTEPAPESLAEVLEEVREFSREIPSHVLEVKTDGERSFARYAIAGVSLLAVGVLTVLLSSPVLQRDDAAFQHPSLITSFKAHDGEVTSVAYSPDENKLATGGKDHTVKLWDLSGAKPKQEATFTGHTGAVWSVAFSPDGRILATASKDETVRLWDVPNIKPIGVFKHFPAEVKSAEFSPDGKSLVTAMSDGTVDVWDLKTLRREQK